MSKHPKSFVVIDTEGKQQLTEIAIINSQGQLIYEAFVREHFHRVGTQYPLKPLRQVVMEFLEVARSHLIVCHFAEHDREVLYNSFKQVGISWQPLHFECSYELVKQHFLGLSSYSLDYLSKYFRLKVDNRYFDSKFAHTARYDAQFTYQLYRKIMEKSQKPLLPHKPNPFGNSRVDSPFQQHPDLREIYQDEFSLLTSVIRDIKNDPNHQSKGAIVLGEAGSGKTHLMMRLANELLKNNRLLFIRQPNNAESVLYHIYSRILESFVEKVPNSSYSQLEYLLAKSFSNIIIDILNKKQKKSKNEELILEFLSQEHLSIYQKFGAEGSEKKRRNWQFLEKVTSDWWSKTYGASNYPNSIIKGLIKFCSYHDPHRQELVRRWLAANELETNELASTGLTSWGEILDKEEFSLQAISVFGRLSIADEPLIIIFDQLEGLKYNESLLINFGEAIKELFTHVPNSLIIINLFPDRWDFFQSFFDNSITDRISQYQIVLNKPPRDKLKTILQLKAQVQDLDIENLFSPAELQVILQQNSIRGVLNCAAQYYHHKVDNMPLPKHIRSFEDEIREEVAKLKAEVAMLKAALGEKLPVIPEVLAMPEGEVALVESNRVTEPTELLDDAQRILNYLHDQKVILETHYLKNVIVSDSDDIGKLRTIIDAFQSFKQFEVDFLRMGKRVLPEHVMVKTTAHACAVGFLQVTHGYSFARRLENFNDLVVAHKEVKFLLFRDATLPDVMAKVAKQEVEKLKNTPNATFMMMDKDNRVTFELIYKLVVDIQNRDLEVALAEALQILETHFSSYWLMRMLNCHSKTDN